MKTAQLRIFNQIFQSCNDMRIAQGKDWGKVLHKHLVQPTVFFRFRAPNSDEIFGLTQANFDANSADFH